jgi:hypothetical protein
MVAEFSLPVAYHKDGSRVKGMTAAGRSLASGTHDKLGHSIWHLVPICLPSIAASR